MLHTIFIVLTDEIVKLVVSKLCFPEGLSFADHRLLIAVFLALDYGLLKFAVNRRDSLPDRGQFN